FESGHRPEPAASRHSVEQTSECCDGFLQDQPCKKPSRSEPTQSKVQELNTQRGRISSFLPLRQIDWGARVDLRGPWRVIDATKIQRFLEQTKTASEIGRSCNRSSIADLFKDPCIALPLDPSGKLFQRTSHFFGTHPYLFRIAPEVAYRI